MRKLGIIKKAVAVGLILALGVTGLTACGKKEESAQTAQKEFVYVPESKTVEIDSQYISSTAASDTTIYGYGESWDEETDTSTSALYAISIADGTVEKLNFVKNDNEYINAMFMGQDNNLVLIMTTDSSADAGAEYEELMNEDSEGAAEAVGTDSGAEVEEPETEEAATEETATEETSTEESTDEEAGNETAVMGDMDAMPAQGYAIWKVSTTDGSILSQTDITEVVNEFDNPYIQYAAEDSDGDLYLSDAQSAVAIVSEDGKKIADIPMNNWIDSMFTAGDGTVYLNYYGDTGIELCPVDKKAKQLGTPVQNVVTGYDTLKFAQGADNQVLISTSSKLSSCDLQAQTKTEMLDWLDSDINTDEMVSFGLLEDGKVWVAAVHQENEKSAEVEITLLTKTKASEVKAKTELVLGTMWLDGDTRQEIIKYNKADNDYRITVKEYATDDYETGLAQMNTDLVGAACPDIIDLSTIDVDNYAQKGVLMDLNPYIEKDESINPDDYLPNVFNVYQRDGKLYGILSSFYIRTLAVKTSLVGDKTEWTLQELMDFANSQDPEADLFQYASKKTVLYNCLGMDINAYVDWTTGKCNFNGENFIAMLEFANKFDDELDFDTMEEEDSTADRLHDGSLLLLDTSISSVQEHQMNVGMMGEPLTYIGYPVSEGCGSVIQPTGCSLGISAKSKNADGAWDFISTFISKDFQEGSVEELGGWGFPVMKSAIDKQFELDMTPEYTKDENGNEIEQVKTSWGMEGFSMDIYAAKQEDVDAVKDLMNRVDKIAVHDTQLYDIVIEEVEPFFEGQKTAQEVADIIQSRIQIYVDENR